MNKCFEIGRLTKSPELRVTASGVSVCTFTLAVDDGFGEKKTTDYFTCVAWRTLGENAAKFLDKGKMAAVIGKLKNRSYDASDGTKRYVTEIICDDIQFLSPKEQNKAPDHQNFNDTDDFEPLDDEQDSQMPF